MDLHDLWVSKALAGRAKDLEFCRAFLGRELVDSDILRDRLRSVTEVPDAVVTKAMDLINPTRAA